MKKETRINARVPVSLKKLMQEFVAKDTNINESDLIRNSIREKIKRDAPELYNHLFEEKPLA
jgi:Arc/MetJ-type ribon-helix-helix transcriptional regulator